MSGRISVSHRSDRAALSRRDFLGLCAGSALAVMSVALGGCSLGPAKVPSKGPDGLIKTTIGYSIWPSCMFWKLATEKGLDREHGIDLTVKTFASSSEVQVAFAGGSIDFEPFDSPGIIGPYCQGIDFVNVLVTDQSCGSEGIIATPDIKSVADLRGKTIATQMYTADHMLLLTLLRDNGMSADDVKIVDMAISESSNAFIAGQCDAASIWDPYFTEAKNAGGTVLYSTADNPNLITDCLMTSGRVAKGNPDLVQRMVALYLDTIAWWGEHHDEGSELMGTEMGVSAEDFDAQVAGLRLSTKESVIREFTPAEDYSYWGYTQNVIRDFMYDLQQIDSKPDCAAMIDDTFIKAYQTA